MKTSRYNYFIHRNGKHVFFNGRTKRFFEVSEKNYEVFKDVIQNPQNYKDKYLVFLEKMLEEGFVVNDDIDELDLVRQAYEQGKCPDAYMLIVLPTYQCNLSCWYCVQKHQDMVMSEETMRRLKLHISNYLKENKIKYFNLSWFGGEPTLEYEKMIAISRYAKDICDRLKVKYNATLTTNGTLLNEERIKELREVNVTDYQITIDGRREQHNKVKRLKEGSAFDIALTNIAHIVRLIPEANCYLRINYTDKNLLPEDIMNDINECIPSDLRKYIKILPKQVWQVQDDKIDDEKVKKLRLEVRKTNYNVHACELGMCYTDRAHFNCIYPNGAVGKCDNEDMSAARGYLGDSGEIVWNTDYPYQTQSILDDAVSCSQCKYLPICWGPCPKMRDEMIMKTGTVQCAFDDKEKKINKYIDSYVESFLKDGK